MLKKSYKKQEDIPADLRGAYVQKGDEWVLDELSDDHPLVVNHEQVKTQLSTEKGKVTRLTNEKSQLEQNVIPAGFKAVPEAEAAYIDKAKQHGTPDEVATKLGEHKTLKEKDQEREQDALYERAAKELGYENPAAFKAAAKAYKLQIVYRPEKVDGKDVERPYVGDKAWADYLKESAELQALEGAFNTKPPAAAAVSTEAGAGNRGAVGAGAGAGSGGEAGKGGGGQQQAQTFRFQDAGDVKW